MEYPRSFERMATLQNSDRPYAQSNQCHCHDTLLGYVNYQPATIILSKDQLKEVPIGYISPGLQEVALYLEMVT